MLDCVLGRRTYFLAFLRRESEAREMGYTGSSLPRRNPSGKKKDSSSKEGPGLSLGPWPLEY